MKNVWKTLAIGAALASAVYAQNNQRQAVITGGGSPDRGKCTLEVVVDGVSQVEIRGNVATLRTISGQPAQWRRFECTGALPANPANFRFTGVDGRGKQELVRDPGNGGVAVVQIEDRNGGAEGYTFDITWDSRGNNGGNLQSDPNRRPVTGINPPGYNGNDNRGNSQYEQNTRPNTGGNPGGYRDNQSPNQYPGRWDNNANRDGSGEYRPDYRDSGYYRRYGHGFAVDEAVRVCKEAVARQAARRFRSNDVHFLRTTIDDNPGRQDWVIGSVDVHRGPREEQYGFSCSVNFDSGQVRSAELDVRPMQSDPRRQ